MEGPEAISTVADDKMDAEVPELGDLEDVEMDEASSAGTGSDEPIDETEKDVNEEVEEDDDLNETEEDDEEEDAEDDERSGDSSGFSVDEDEFAEVDEIEPIDTKEQLEDLRRKCAEKGLVLAGVRTRVEVDYKDIFERYGGRDFHDPDDDPLKTPYSRKRKRNQGSCTSKLRQSNEKDSNLPDRPLSPILNRTCAETPKRSPKKMKLSGRNIAETDFPNAAVIAAGSTTRKSSGEGLQVNGSKESGQEQCSKPVDSGQDGAQDLALVTSLVQENPKADGGKLKSIVSSLITAPLKGSTSKIVSLATSVDELNICANPKSKNVGPRRNLNTVLMPGGKIALPNRNNPVKAGEGSAKPEVSCEKGPETEQIQASGQENYSKPAVSEQPSNKGSVVAPNAVPTIGGPKERKRKPALQFPRTARPALRPSTSKTATLATVVANLKNRAKAQTLSLSDSPLSQLFSGPDTSKPTARNRRSKTVLEVSMEFFNQSLTEDSSTQMGKKD